MLSRGESSDSLLSFLWHHYSWVVEGPSLLLGLIKFSLLLSLLWNYPSRSLGHLVKAWWGWKSRLPTHTLLVRDSPLSGLLAEKVGFGGVLSVSFGVYRFLLHFQLGCTMQEDTSILVLRSWDPTLTTTFSLSFKVFLHLFYILYLIVLSRWNREKYTYFIFLEAETIKTHF